MCKVFFLVGPTATGKTAVAQKIAEERGWDILSADSMLIYKGMNIGTAKPSTAEQSKVNYFGIDLAEPSEVFSVRDYYLHALSALEIVKKKKKNLIVTGGTGLYIKAVLQGLSESAPPDYGAREIWTELLKTKGLQALQNKLQTINPRIYEALSDKENPRRLIRALEQAESDCGIVKRSWKSAEQPEIYGINFPRKTLIRRITERVEHMFDSGLLEEVGDLCNAGLESAPTAIQGIGYSEALAVLQNKMDIETAKEQIVLRTKRLAKRQMTWFRNQANVNWFDAEPEDTINTICREISERWDKSGGIFIDDLIAIHKPESCE
ncbi:MAG: tRNA (adenosine(37)-N6)-dimethylallyltransferase MiaA [Lentisphaerae bacterium]|nr:tRNA (adenosine(37)-N6)-dimethylallyltransferase MiaA [Lentisphaerota bacterium]